MSLVRLRASLVGATTLAALQFFVACTGGSAGDRDNRGTFKVTSISTGRGTIFPYRIRVADSFGNPTTAVVNIEDAATLHANVSANNGVLPVATYDNSAELPNGSPGNQYLHVVFSHKLAVDSILSNLLSNQIQSGLSGALNVFGYDPVGETSQTVRGRAFVGGFTWFNDGGVLHKVKAVEADGDGVRILDPRALGFPDFPGAADLVGPKSFVFIADPDDHLNTFDTFPTDRLLRIIITSAVRDSEGHALEQEVGTATTVGVDPDPPQVLGYTAAPQISPGNAQGNVDPRTTILVRFNKPVQPREVGSFFDPRRFTPPAGGVVLAATTAARTFDVLYHADPIGFGDLGTYLITPAYVLPGDASVVVSVLDTTVHSLTGRLIGQQVSTQFSTSAGPGIVNAPVAPEAIYVGLAGAQPGVAVIDLNGFGQGTGDLASTRFPRNPNVNAVGLRPALVPGTSNVDAGSGGALTLVRDSRLETRLLREPVVGAVSDIHIGAPLDLVFNNENINVNVNRANQVDPVTGGQAPGNCISVAPHPNPPKLVFPPPNPDRSIFCEEPTAAGPRNLLVAGNPFANEIGQVGIFGTIQLGVFNGPTPPPLSPPPPPAYHPFNIRQQIGHFLYVLDSDNRRVLVVNSNRMTVLDTIAVVDPVAIAVSPNLSRLAIVSTASSRVSFVDIDPFSATFHQVVAETRTPPGPVEVAWQPDGEDVLVVCNASNSVAVIHASDLTIRKTLSSFLDGPIDIAVTPRFQTTGFGQGLYFAYVLNANGTVAVFESGPDGINGIGFDEMIGLVPGVSFPRASRLRYDYGSSTGDLLIGHVDDTGLGVVSRLVMTVSPGVTLLNPNFGGIVLPPTFRQKEWRVLQRFGGFDPSRPVHQQLSGNSIADLCLDELRNAGGAPGQITPFNTSVLPSFGHSGKEAVMGGGPATSPRLLFIALSDVGKIDVFETATGARMATIDAPGVHAVASYWRQ